MTPEERQPLMDKIRAFPAELEALVTPLTPDQLITIAIPNEWTVAQVVHHIADAHLHAYARFKWVLIEDYPTFKPYEQEDWARTRDATHVPVQDSLWMVRGLHGRWATLMDSLTDSEWQRKGLHPVLGEISLEGLLQGYARHSQNHYDQIVKIIEAF